MQHDYKSLFIVFVSLLLLVVGGGYFNNFHLDLDSPLITAKVIDFSSDKHCLEGEVRCVASTSGDTQWVQLCMDEIWTNWDYCETGCESARCYPSEYILTLNGDSDSIKKARSAIITAKLFKINYEGYTPVSGQIISLGSNQGYFIGTSYVTDENGEINAAFIASEKGDALIKAVANINGDILQDFTYVSVD